MKPYLQWCYCLLFTLLSINASAQEITTIAGNGISGFSVDGGQATDASINDAVAITLDSAGNIYISDSRNHRIRKINFTNKIITTVAGTGANGYFGDGGDAKYAQLSTPVGLAFDKYGNLHFADGGNHVIRKIDNSGVIHTIAGTGVQGCDGDGALATMAKLSFPYGLAFDDDNLYFSDLLCHTVRAINSAGIISTVAGITGSSGYSGDNGPATNAKMVYPGFIGINKNTSVMYIPDHVNSRVRKVDLNSGIITTAAGNGFSGYNGDGGLATNAALTSPNSVSIDSYENIIICDNLAHVIRKIDTSGIISTIAGIGEVGYSPDGTTATTAKFNRPNYTVSDKWDNIYFCDVYNHLVRRINYNTTSVKEQPITYIKASIFPNPAHEYVTVKTEGVAINELQLLDVTGCEVHSSVYKAHKGEIKLVIAHLPTGTYLLKINGQYAGKVVKE